MDPVIVGLRRLRSDAEHLRKQGIELNGTEKVSSCIYSLNALTRNSFSSGQSTGRSYSGWRPCRDLWTGFFPQQGWEHWWSSCQRGRRRCHRCRQPDANQDSLRPDCLNWILSYVFSTIINTQPVIVTVWLCRLLTPPSLGWNDTVFNLHWTWLPY